MVPILLSLKVTQRIGKEVVAAIAHNEEFLLLLEANKDDQDFGHFVHKPEGNLPIGAGDAYENHKQHQQAESAKLFCKVTSAGSSTSSGSAETAAAAGAAPGA